MAGARRIRDRARLFRQQPPLTAKGRFALARALLTDGDRAGAQALVREAWRNDSFSQELEAQALDLFGELITRADDKARMDRALYAKDDLDAGLRAAQRLGGDQPAIAKARIAVLRRPATPRPCSTRCRPPRAATPATSSPTSSGCAATTRSPKPAR